MAPRRWLILVHLLPPSPSNLRVRTWRRLQELGAVAIKQSVYVLPDTPETREDFEWLRVEIEGASGEAVVYSADHVDPAAEADLIEQFRDARQQAYAKLSTEIRQHQRGAKSRRTLTGSRDNLTRYRQRLAAIERVDFFSSPARDPVVKLIADLEGASSTSDRARQSSKARAQEGPAEYRGRLWVTRPHPGVDRMSSAWLIRRFVDPAARFSFVTDIKSAGDAIPFDMFGGGFGHEGDRCTFEILASRFTPKDAAVSRIAEIVHDLDLKDDKFGAPETATVGVAIDGMRLAQPDDRLLLDQGMTLFEALYQSFARAKAPRRRAAAKPGGKLKRARRR